MATTTQTRTGIKAVAAVGVLAAVGFIGFAAAMVISPSTGMLKPDLVIGMKSDAKVSSSSVTYGNSREYTVTLKNDGRSSASNFKATVTSDVAIASVSGGSTLFSCSQTADTTVECNGVLLASNSSQTFTVSLENNAETTASCGETKEVNLIAQVDTTSVVTESDETNNSATNTVTFRGPAEGQCADLRMYTSSEEDLESGSSPVPYDEEFSFNDSDFGIANDGELDIDSEIYMVYSIPAELEVVGYRSVFRCKGEFYLDEIECYSDGIEGGFSYDGDVILKNAATETEIPCGTTKDVEVTATVDPDDEITETLETNNTITHTVTLASSC